MPMPLAGVQALDLTSGVAGPYCTKILADYGADVIKVEPPQHGDVSRQLDGAADDDTTSTAPLFLQLNTNKRSITLDITTDAGADVLKRLLRRVDLLVDDGALSTAAAGDGWSHEAISAANQRLVITSISPFGPDGPHADYRATEIVLSALGGWSFPMGDPGRTPLQPGGPYISYVAGLWAATGTLTALFSAGLTGFGQEVHISMLEAAVATTVEDTVRHSYTGEARGRYGESWGAGLMPSVQPCADGHVVLMGGPYRDQIFTLFGQPTPSEEDRPSDEELRAQFREFAAGRTRDELFHAAQALRLPFAPVVTPQEILDSPQHRDRDYFAEVAHPEAGRLRHTGPPIQLGESPAAAPRPAPTLGQDNQDVYTELGGLSLDEIAALQRSGVV